MTSARPRHPDAITFLFSAGVFFSAALLFLVEPLAARAVLPRFGGTSSVWTSCMLFFQGGLLAGYGYAHLIGSRSDKPWSYLFHGGFLVVLLGLGSWNPDAIAKDPGDPLRSQSVSLLLLLGRHIGLPFLALATTAPLLQRWYRTSRPDRSPYFLYAASNAGSLLALCLYPLWIESHVPLAAQGRLWSIGLRLALAFHLVCGSIALLRRDRSDPERISESSHEPATPADWLRWIALAFIPASLLLGVTTYLTTDLASIPLLWAIPLALYLSSFILAFSPLNPRCARISARLLPFLFAVQAATMAAGFAWIQLILLHLTTFFFASLLCHAELASRKPPPENLTSFYLATAIGGVLGGVFNALVAPALFDRPTEYTLALIAACLVPAFRAGQPRFETLDAKLLVFPTALAILAAVLFVDPGGLSTSFAGVVLTMLAAGLTFLAMFTHRRKPIRFVLSIGGVLAASSLSSAVTGHVIHRERNFFGVLTVTAVQDPPAHRFFHGTTLHGEQSLEPARRREPLTYFTRSGPIGRIFEVFDNRPGSSSARIGVTGMGAGSLAAYARAGQDWRFFEIDPAVVKIASDPIYFRYLTDSPASSLTAVTGDARLTLGRERDASFDLLILDAFSSDAIPAHLLTREAFSLYRRKLRPRGLIVANITNRYLNLAPVVAALALDAGWAARVRVDSKISPEERRKGRHGSIWALLAESTSDLGPIATDPLWLPPKSRLGENVWTDDFHGALNHLWNFSSVDVP